MQTDKKWEKIRDKCIVFIIVILCILTVCFDFIPITFTENAFINRMLSGIIQQASGSIAVILLMIRLRIRLFCKPKHILYLIPCVIIAIDNFPFCSYFAGNMHFRDAIWVEYVLFTIYCISVGVFEECIFRGIIFSVLAGHFSKDKKGFLLTYLFSSLIFGLSHLLNIFMGAGVGATILQVGYTILTGGLFGFALIKTKNVLCAAFIHALYNFCGLLLSKQGLGSGIVFDVGTVITMAIISVCIALFVLYKVWNISEEERNELYELLGIQKGKTEL